MSQGQGLIGDPVAGVTQITSPTAVRSSVLQWGAVGDGSHDDTSAIQLAINDIANSHGTLYFPPGNYLISSRLTTPQTWGWAIEGAGRRQTTITQSANNVPIIDHGAGAAISLMHSISISGLTLQYTNTQSSANTGAVCLRFSASTYQCNYTDLEFINGNYGIGTANGVVGSWGCTWDNLVFWGTLTKGAIDNSLQNVAGVPGNHYGRIYVTATNMVGPIFAAWAGEGCVVDTVEINNAFLSPQLATFASGSQFTFGSFKLEGYTYNNGVTNYNLITVGVNTFVSFGILRIGGSNAVVTNNTGIHLTSTAAGGFLKVGSLYLVASSITGGSTAAFTGAGQAIVDRVENGMAGGWTLGDWGASAGNETLRVNSLLEGHISFAADADLTIALVNVDPAPNIYRFATTLTAARTVNLPTDMGNYFNGLWYEFQSYGGVNGANTVTIKCGATTIATLSADKQVVRILESRRSVGSAPGNWFVVHTETLP